MKKKIQPNIVLVSEHPDDDEVVAKQLSGDYQERFFWAKGNPVARKAFHTGDTRVLLLSYRSIRDALHFYNMLLDSSSDQIVAEHRVIICCRKNEEGIAYQAFQSDLIDEYFISKPLFEMHRPSALVKQMLKELGEYDLISRRLPLSCHDESIQKIVEVGQDKKEAVKKQANKTITALEDQLDKAISELPCHQNMKELVDISVVREVLAQYKNNQLRPQISQLENKVCDFLQAVIEHTSTTIDLYRSAAKEPKPPTLEHQPKILVVDDDPWCLRLVSGVLEKEAMKVDTASNATDALEKIRREDYQLVFMDIELPDSDGITVIEDMRSEGRNHNTPVVMLTGRKDTDAVNRSKVAKVQGYLVKPVKKNKLLEKLSRFVVGA
ncbi:response regulator [Algicola sagamiensis]|uniref:response regulator n=1 Tax=Algicola sagamiensis TaxID=163869 RepID=UPI00146EC8B3|nr:response regulator [Algicola sagamiensis]